MPESSVTLTAKYKVEYTIELWLQNTTLDGYEKSDSLTGYEYVGTSYTADKSVSGFKVVDNASTVSTKTLTANKSENLFKLYYDREEYSVSFMANYPDGTTGDNRTITARYGVEVTLPTDYSVEGYSLVGWSKSANGSVDYKVNYIESLVYNSDNSPQKEIRHFMQYGARAMLICSAATIAFISLTKLLRLFTSTGAAYISRANTTKRQRNLLSLMQAIQLSLKAELIRTALLFITTKREAAIQAHVLL
jgi:hypothetical protein